MLASVGWESEAHPDVKLSNHIGLGFIDATAAR